MSAMVSSEAPSGTGDAAPDTRGCRSGAACRFSHEVLDAVQPSTAASAGRSLPSRPVAHAADRAQGPIAPSGDTAGRQDAASNTPRITHRPAPQSQLGDPRAYQIAQIRRRFPPIEEHNENGATILSFRLSPSDPDFPFDMDALHCSLRVPSDYPSCEKPTLRVTNPDMERGYQINVERGFDRIVAGSQSMNLLRCFNALDKQLESLLSSEKAETIKLVPNKGKSQPAKSWPPAQKPDVPAPAIPIRHQSSAGIVAVAASAAASVPASKPVFKPAPEPVPTPQARERAMEVRNAETRQLEGRLGKLPQFQKSADGLAFTIPIDVRKRLELPVELQAVKQVKLTVPEAYNITPCRIELVGVSGPSAEAVVTAFGDRAKSHPELTLLNHINYVSQNIQIMAKVHAKNQDTVAVADVPEASSSQSPDAAETEPRAGPLVELSDRPHVIFVPRPPEWDIVNGDEDKNSDTSSESGDEDHSWHDDEEGEGTQDPVPAQTRPSERGILITFPNLELHGIELLTISALNITVKCERCKDTKDIKFLLTGTTASQPRTESCKKCADSWAVAFRGELMHMNSNRAGYVDLEGCTIVDMLLSSFIPTCSECSTAHPEPVKAVRGDTPISFCRSCHRKMTFRIPEIKFLRTGASGLPLKASTRPKKKTENLGIVVGRELPNRGRCSHYKKSYRWFRFSCCSKVFPCDRCHDESEDHVIEHANRMICGSCSREQNYRPKDCGICHSWLTVKPGKGFWNGGQGTRDQTKMSRKDPRKYKRIGSAKAKA